jgi:hypothetical protein
MKATRVERKPKEWRPDLWTLSLHYARNAAKKAIRDEGKKIGTSRLPRLQGEPTISSPPIQRCLSLRPGR